MNSKESKAILKEVREAIKGEKYSEAIEKCQNLLKDEPENYMAYLLLGAAHQNNNKTEAAKHLRRAVELSPAAPTVALQGLANCAPINELPKIYEQLIQLVPEKFKDYCEKLFLLSDNRNLARECFDILKKESQKDMNEECCSLICKYLVKVWITNDFEVLDNEENLFKRILEATITDTTSDLHLGAYKRYLKLLYKQQDYENCIHHACLVVEQYPTDIYAYEWICKIYCEYYQDENNVWQYQLKRSIDFYADELLKLNANSGLALLIKAIGLYAREQYVEARDLLVKVQAVLLNYGVAMELLARSEMKLGAYEMAIPLWLQLNKTREYAICLSHTDSTMDVFKEAVNILNECEKTLEIAYALARCYFKMDEIKKIDELHIPLEICSKAEFLMSPNDGIKLLQANTDPESFSTYFTMGKLYVKLNKPAEALPWMLKATRLQPFRSECFYYLGQIYRLTDDTIRARKCYEKCIYLNPMCVDAVNNLSSLYEDMKEEELNVALLLNALKYIKSEKAQSIHYKLGLHYKHAQKWDDAIHSFRSAIKYNVDCLIYWESLGDAYNERGSYHSAIRVFQKILEIDEECVYALLSIGLIKSTIRMFSEAIEDFDKLLQKHPNYFPALKGCAEAHIGLANNLRLERRYGRCKAHLQLAINHLQRAYVEVAQLQMVWIWRLIAYVFILVSQLPLSLANLEVSGKLAKRDTEIAILNHTDLLILAKRFYTIALNLKPSTYLWYELSHCCYLCAEYMPGDAPAHLDVAIKTAQMAIKTQSNSWQNWNLLGVIHMHEAINNLPIAQHCFIQAVTIERKAYTAWTNLGVLYLKLKEIKLANQAFQRAQQSNPMFPNAWIGQAMIAEEIGEEEEALDLFRHCQLFEYHPQASLGYAHWVCHIILDALKCEQPHYKHAIESMYADVLALDAINLYTKNEETASTVAALSFQGFLNIRQKLYQPAVKSYIQAVKNASETAERDVMLTNLGYLYLKLNQSQDAINAFNSVSEATFKPIIGLALAYYRAGQHQESYSVYNSVLKSLDSSDGDKSARILVAMASMVYASQGEADTKTILYQCILLKDYPIQALYSACALGILHEDDQLTTTILNELKKYENSEQHCAHIAFLTSQYYVHNKETHRGLIYLMTRVHLFPHNAELRKILANYLIDNFSEVRKYHVAASQIALSAIPLVHRSKSKKNDSSEDAKTLLIASRALKPVNEVKSLKLIQRSIHLHPQNKNAWDALVKVAV